MAKLTKKQTEQIMDTLRWLMKDNNGEAYNALSAFYVEHAPAEAQK